MSLQASLKELRVKLQQKNMILVSGNVYDIFPLNGLKDQTNVSKYIADILKSFDYDSVFRFSPKTGLINLINNQNVLKEKIAEKSFMSDDDEQEEKENIPYSYENFLNKIIEDIKEFKIGDKLNAYIIDFADIYFYKQDDRENKNILADLLSLFLDNFKQQVSNLRKQMPKIIFIQRNPNQLPQFIRIDNPELSIIEILYPDSDERSDWFSSYAQLLSVKDADILQNKNSKQHEEAVALTSKLQFRELMQLARIQRDLNNDSIGDITFKELYNLAFLNKRESDWEKLSAEKIMNIPKEYKEKLFGQDEAIEKLKDTLILSKMGMSSVTHSSVTAKPKGVLFFAGPTGTGKTELAKMLARTVFGDEKRIIRFDMSEYSSRESSIKFIGSEPGYVGYEAGGQLTNAIKQNPFSILLFDEIEKADDSVLDKFLQILDDGRLTSSQGELVDFSETFIIFTSNKGHENTDPAFDKKENQKIFKKNVINYFKNSKIDGGLGRPELLNRIGESNIATFNYITDDNIIAPLIKSKIKKVNQIIKIKQFISLNISDDTMNNIINYIKSKYDKTMGGRGINNVIQENYVKQIAISLFNNFSKLSEFSKEKYGNADLFFEDNIINIKL